MSRFKFSILAIAISLPAAAQACPFHGGADGARFSPFSAMAGSQASFSSPRSSTEQRNNRGSSQGEPVSSDNWEEEQNDSNQDYDDSYTYDPADAATFR